MLYKNLISKINYSFKYLFWKKKRETKFYFFPKRDKNTITYLFKKRKERKILQLQSSLNIYKQ